MDFSKIDDEFAREVIREAESYLEGQVVIATSADQRASAMASVFTAAGAALVAGVITISRDGDGAIIVAGIVSAVLFLSAASFCVAATIPRAFWLPGAKPSDWADDIVRGTALKDCLGDQARNFQERIDYNNKVIARNANWFRWGAILGIAAPIAGAAAWAAVRCYLL